MERVSRREFFGAATAVVATVGATTAPAQRTASKLFDVTRVPDLISVYDEGDASLIPLTRQGSHWQSSGIEVRTGTQASGLAIYVTAPANPLTRIHLRWKMTLNPALLFMGDAWERSYGDLAWRTMVPERVLPWYFAAHDTAAGVTHGYGVMTGAGAFCFWQVDPAGVSLWLDVSNGGMGVMLGQRELHAVTIVSRQGHAGEHPSDAVAGLCRLMCPEPRLPEGPIYGTNDWYYALWQ